MKERERNEVELDERLGKVPVSTLAGKGTRYFSGRVSKKKKKEIFFWALQAVNFRVPCRALFSQHGSAAKDSTTILA